MSKKSMYDICRICGENKKLYLISSFFTELPNQKRYWNRLIARVVFSIMYAVAGKQEGCRKDWVFSIGVYSDTEW